MEKDLEQQRMRGKEEDILSAVSMLSKSYIFEEKWNKAVPLLVEVLQSKSAGEADRRFACKTLCGAGEYLREWAEEQDSGVMSSLCNFLFQAASGESLDEETRLFSFVKSTYMRCLSSLGPDHPKTLAAMRYMALCVFNAHTKNRDDAAGHIDEKDTAFALFLDLVARSKRVHGPDHELTAVYSTSLDSCLQIMTSVGYSFFADERYAKALFIWSDELAVRRQFNDEDDKLLLLAMNNCAVALLELKRYEAALPLAEECLKGRTKKFGAQHPATLLTQQTADKIIFELSKTGIGALSPVHWKGDNFQVTLDPLLLPVSWGISILSYAAMPLTFGDVSFLGPELLTKGGGRPTADVLRGKKRLGIYFSAHWCPPCRAFTPALIEFYRTLGQVRSDALEIVFVSCDETADEFHEYYRGMPWAALAFGSAAIKAVGSKYSSDGIPALFIVDASTGAVVDPDGRSTIISHEDKPSGALSKWNL